MKLILQINQYLKLCLNNFLNLPTFDPSQLYLEQGLHQAN